MTPGHKLELLKIHKEVLLCNFIDIYFKLLNIHLHLDHSF